MTDHNKQIADIMEDLIQGHNWDYADKEFRKLVKEAFEDGRENGQCRGCDVDTTYCAKCEKALQS